MRPRAAVREPCQPLIEIAADPLVDGLPADAELLGDLTWLMTRKDSLNEQQTAVNGQTGISVSHEGLQG